MSAEAGYATPAAAVIAVSLAMLAAASMDRAMSALRLAKADLARTQAEYALGAAQDGAVLEIATSSEPPPYRWTLASLGQAVDVVAEPEALKAAPATMGALPDPSLEALGVTDVTAFRSATTSEVGRHALPWMADAAPSPRWRLCGPAVSSPYGQASSLPLLTYADPAGGRRTPFWRAGEVWRVQTTDPQGWREERIVRFTGNGLSPTAIIGRRVSRHAPGETTTCQL